MNFPSRETVAHLRTLYPAGMRVGLIRMNDPHTRLRPGNLGTVIEVDDAGTIHVAWDCGITLGAVWGEDRISWFTDVPCSVCDTSFCALLDIDDAGWYCVCPHCATYVDEEGHDCTLRK